MSHTTESFIGERPLLTSDAVMTRLGFKNRSAFWKYVWTAGLPAIRLNQRNIKFDAQQVEDFLARRSTGKVAA